VAGQKRRKPKGVMTSQEAQQRAAAARVKERAKETAARKREKEKADRQAAREREIAAGQAEAEAITRVQQTRVTELETLLLSTLDKDPYIDFERLKEPMAGMEFRPPEDLAKSSPVPVEASFLPEAPAGLGALLPGRQRAYSQALEAGRARYRQAQADHGAAERVRQERLSRTRAEHERHVTAERARIDQQHRSVEEWAERFAAGERRAVRDYLAEVLGRQRYPADFPTGVKVDYGRGERMAVVDVDLPLLEAVPELASAEYQPVKKAIKYISLTQTARTRLYQLIIAQMALRTLRAIFVADRARHVAKVVCNGYVDTINTATGRPAHWCLVSVEVTRELFEELDLSQVKPLDCLTYLHAKVSKTPEKFTPVQPIIDYPWDDLPYSDETDSVADLDSVQNLLELDGYEFERLMVQLFEAISTFDEVRRTRSRGDGGIDLVAVNTTPFIGGRVAIQAKRYAPHRKVDIAAVREIVGSISQREFNKGIIITTSNFTSAARDEATRLGIELYDCERLLWLLRQHLHRDFTVIDHGRRKAPFIKPPPP
jgi:restriction system protein